MQLVVISLCTGLSSTDGGSSKIWDTDYYTTTTTTTIILLLHESSTTTALYYDYISYTAMYGYNCTPHWILRLAFVQLYS